MGLKQGKQEEMPAIQALELAILLASFEQENTPNKFSGWFREMYRLRNSLSKLKISLEGDPKMSTDMNFFRGSRTKQTGQTDQPQEMPEMPEQIRVAVEKLAAEFNKLRESLLKIEARLTALESGAQVEQKAKQNGHVRSFQSDIIQHTKRVAK